MKGYGIPCVLLCCVLGCASSGPSGTYVPGLSTITLDEYYDVTGSTAAALHQEMLRRGPRIDGQSFYGEMYWTLRWRFRFASRSGQCEMEQVEVPLTITIMLPRWHRPADVDAALAEQWDAFLASLRLHEEGHRSLAMEAGREIIRALRSMRTLSCSSMEAEANRKAGAILDRYREHNRQYDRDTGHGRRQGAVWPPRERG
ncbi:MAG: DUF922 domain-containing Zn-dependent protease [Rhodothermales bacterium]|nr:DUF922 domain-containing Zn-dependent protease [Rhodothermales bacterium]